MSHDRIPSRQPHEFLTPVIKPGYGVDNNAAIYFEDSEVRKVIALDEPSNAFYVSLKNGEAMEEKH